MQFVAGMVLVLGPIVAQQTERAADDELTRLESAFRACRTAACSDSMFVQWERASWRRASRLGTRTGLRSYLIAFPGGPHADSANAAIHDLDWASCRDGDTTAPCSQYLATHRRGAFRAQAKKRLDEAEYRQAESQNTVVAYERFLKTHAGHAQATSRLQDLRYEQARQSNALEDWIAFYDKSNLSSSAQREWTSDARRRHSQMRANAQETIEQQLYERIVADPSLDDVSRYLKRNPSGRHRQQVLVLSEPVFLADVRSKRTSRAYRDYLKRYPAGFSAVEVAQLLQESTFREALAARSRRGLESYLREFPEGSHAREADSIVSSMKAIRADPIIVVPDSLVGSGSQPRFSWVTRFKEGSGKVGFSVTGKGWIIDARGRRWGPQGHIASRGTVKVVAGGSGREDHWVRGKSFCGGRLQYSWTGTDDNGNKVILEERIRLVCRSGAP